MTWISLYRHLFVASFSHQFAAVLSLLVPPSGSRNTTRNGEFDILMRLPLLMRQIFPWFPLVRRLSGYRTCVTGRLRTQSCFVERSIEGTRQKQTGYDPALISPFAPASLMFHFG